MALKVDFLTIDARDSRRLAEFWAEALEDYAILEDDDDEDVVVLPVTKRGPKLLFQQVPDEKAGKNRFHLDLRPEGAGTEDEVARLEALGATRVDIGQGDVSWVVMADVEGNEFCVLRRLSDEEKEKHSSWAW